MSHIEYAKWIMYVANELDEETRYLYEQHLFSCDQCLELYLKAVESNITASPQLKEDFTDKVLDYVTKHTVSKQQKYKRSNFQKSFFHYVIAAAMTFILMSSGLFGQLTEVVSQFEKAGNEQTQSFTEKLIDKTMSFIQIDERNKEVK